MTEEEKKIQEREKQHCIRLLKKGGKLHCWRDSSPHNWWIEPPKYYKKGWFIYHWEGAPGFIQSLKTICKKENDSDQKVIQYWGSDSGMSCHSIWVYDQTEEHLK